MTVVVRPGDLDAHREAVIELFVRHLNPLYDAARFEWVYRRNPDGPGRLWVAVDDASGELAGAASPARADTPLVGADLASDGGRFTVPLDPGFEHALVVLTGSLAVGETQVVPGHLAYLGQGREQLDLAAEGQTRALLLGGEPLGEQIVMSWNFVGRSRDEVAQAAADWNAGADRFGIVDSSLARIPAP